MGDFVQAPHPPERDEDEQPVYRPIQAGERFWQGEILGNVTQLTVNVESLQLHNQEQLVLAPIVHDLVIVMTQDCDLEQDYARRAGRQQSSLPNILLCDVYPAEVLRARIQGFERREWRKRIAQNQIDRFQYLQRVGPDQDLQGQGLTALAIDFKVYFTLPTDELYARLPEIQRRCRLATPYVEHLAHRFFKFQSRVALPQDHEIDPIPD